MTSLAERRGRVWAWGLWGPCGSRLLTGSHRCQSPEDSHGTGGGRFFRQITPLSALRSEKVEFCSCLLKRIAWKEMTGPILHAIRRYPRDTHSGSTGSRDTVFLSLTVWRWLSPLQPSPPPHTYLADASDGSLVHLLFLLLFFAPPPPPFLPANLPPQRNCLLTVPQSPSWLCGRWCIF